MTKILILATVVLAAMPCWAQAAPTSDIITGPTIFTFDDSVLHCKSNEKVVERKDGTIHTIACEIIPADPSKPDWKLQPVQHWVPTCSSGYELWWEPDPNLYGIMSTTFGSSDRYIDSKIDIDSTYGPGIIPAYYECRPIGSLPKVELPRNVWGTTRINR